MTPNEYKEAIAWSGSCEICFTCVIVYPHQEGSAEDLEWLDNADWDGFPECYLCGGTIKWTGTAPIDEVRL